MNTTTMQDFLTAINATQSPQGYISFDNKNSITEQVASAYATVLGESGFIQVRGADAAKFLQGQITCDMDEVSDSQVRFGAHCTHKGRMIASFVISKISTDTYLLKLPKNNVDTLLASLKKYIVFSKAEAIIANDNWIAFGLSGEAATAVVEQYFGEAPSKAHLKQTKDNAHCHKLPGSPRYEICLEPNQAQSFWAHCIAALATANSQCWQLENIRNGIGEIDNAITEVFIPQAINLQEIAGISFTKGCYTGQEIIARMKYLGKQKRHMAHFSATGQALIQGSNVFTQAGKNVGEIVNCISVDNNCEGLVVIVNDAISDAIFGGDNKDQTLSFTPLSYAS